MDKDRYAVLTAGDEVILIDTEKMDSIKFSKEDARAIVGAIVEAVELKVDIVI